MVNDVKPNVGMVAGKNDELVLDKTVVVLRGPTRGSSGEVVGVEEGLFVGESKVMVASLLCSEETSRRERAA